MKSGSNTSFREAAELPDQEDYEPEPPEEEPWIQEMHREMDALRSQLASSELRESNLRQALQDFYDSWAAGDTKWMNVSSKNAWKALSFPGPSARLTYAALEARVQQAEEKSDAYAHLMHMISLAHPDTFPIPPTVAERAQLAAAVLRAVKVAADKQDEALAFTENLSGPADHVKLGNLWAEFDDLCLEVTAAYRALRAAQGGEG